MLLIFLHKSLYDLTSLLVTPDGFKNYPVQTGTCRIKSFPAHLCRKPNGLATEHAVSGNVDFLLSQVKRDFVLKLLGIVMPCHTGSENTQCYEPDVCPHARVPNGAFALVPLVELQRNHWRIALWHKSHSATRIKACPLLCQEDPRGEVMAQPLVVLRPVYGH